MTNQTWSVCYDCGNPACLYGRHTRVLTTTASVTPADIVDDLLSRGAPRVWWLMRMPTPKQ